MRLLYIDIDTQRPDHLGCYGYPRATSPNIDRIAEQGIRFERVYASDTPCLPSRSALITGRFGIHNGAIGHGGTAGDLALDGESRGFRNTLGVASWATRMANRGMRTATVSSFATRHCSYHWLAGFRESYDVGKGGLESADEVNAIALDWLDRHGHEEDWFLHVHYWDPHTPYRAPASMGEPFAQEPLPGWLSEEVRAEHWKGYGPHSAREVMGFGVDPAVQKLFPRQPLECPSLDEVRALVDGYDCGVLYADEHAGQLFEKLASLQVFDDTAVMISADHGETLGELNIYGDHQTADELTARVPMILRWPELGDDHAGRVDRGFHYQFDVAASVLELLGARVPRSWDGRSFAPALREGREEGRDELIVSQAAWTCQRSVRWDDWIGIRTYHDGYHAFPEWMLFDVAKDPHETTDLASENSGVIEQAATRLDAWYDEMAQPEDPMQTVMREGGPFHTRGQLARYVQRLRETEREHWARALEERHPSEL
ncbi:MAG: sulfatase [Myxococcota bacterium]